MKIRYLMGFCLASVFLTGYSPMRLQAAEGSEELNKILAMPAAEVKQKTAALSALASSLDLAARFDGYYLSMKLGKKDLVRMQRNEMACCEELVKLNPRNADLRIQLGYVYIEAERADSAKEQFEAVLAMEKLSDLQQGDALLGLANAAILKGDKVGAVSFCQELLNRKLKTDRRYGTNPGQQAYLALQYLSGYKMDSTQLPFFTGGKVFPTPQQAQYKEDSVALKSVKLELGKGLDLEDPRVQLLRQKFGRLGIAIETKAPFAVKINTEPAPSAPQKAEGYALRITKDSAIINSYDKQGTLWGIVSLIQLVDRDKKTVHLCDIVDFPNAKKRGFLESYWAGALEFGLFAKMNSFVAQTGVQLVYNEGYRPWTPLQKAIAAETCRQFKALGLDYYMGICGLTMYPKMPLSSERTMDLLKERCSFVAAAGGDIYFPYDDGRYPLHPADIEKYGKGSRLDAKRVDQLYKAVHGKYPEFKLVFCPPYYAVPDGMGDESYPDDRDAYLKSIGDELDPAVEVYWTGPRVAGLEKPKEKRDYFANLIKRSPAIFQNRVRPHNHLSYITDVITGWSEWHYDGFVENEISLFHKNGAAGEATLVATLADYLWNVKAYDAQRSIRESVAMLYGKDMFDILDPGTKAMTYLDKYIYGAITPEALTEIPKIEECYNIASNCYEKAVAYNALSMRNYPASYARGVEFAQKALGSARNPPDFLKKYQKDIAETRTQAEAEVGINLTKGDLYKSPVDFFGGRLIVYDNKCPKRFANLLYGKRSPAPSVRTQFESYPFPPEGNYELHISGQQEVSPGKSPCAIRVAVNGKTVFEGPSRFVHKGWSLDKFILPISALQRYNTITIENIEDSENPQGPPWVMINYGVIKKAVK